MRLYLRCGGTDGKVDDAGTEDHRQSAVDEGAQQGAQPADPGVGMRLVGTHQHHLGQFALPDAGGGHERQAVAAGPVDEVIRAVPGERLKQRTAVVAERARREHLLDHRLAVAQDAQVEGNGSGVDTGYSGHIIGP